MAKTEVITFKDQVYFAPADIIVWMKFYLLSGTAFKEAFPEGYEEIANMFFWDYRIGGGGLAGDGFNLDHFLNDGNIDLFAGIVANILISNSLSRSEIMAMVAASEALKPFKEETVQKFVSENISFDGNFSVKEHFEMLLRALKMRSFYLLANINIEQLAGQWASTAETGALSINYNMTDFMPLGDRVRLLITKFDERFYTFTCMVRVHDYVSNEELEIAVRDTYVTLENGYLYHYYKMKEGFELSFRRPIFEYYGNTFKTQFGNVGLTFERA